MENIQSKLDKEHNNNNEELLSRIVKALRSRGNVLTFRIIDGVDSEELLIPDVLRTEMMCTVNDLLTRMYTTKPHTNARK